MKLNKAWIVLFFFLCLINFKCIPVKYHDYAATNEETAVEIIQKLKKDTLLIVVPTFHQKEILLKNITKSGNKNRKINKQKLLNLQVERELLQKALIQSFQEHFTFSEVLFIPDSLVYRVESGNFGPYFLSNNVRIDSTIQYVNRNPIKLVQQFDQEWQIKIGNQLTPNPFPNYYIYRNGLYGFLGGESFEKMYSRVASIFQKRFDQFYTNPDQRIYL